MSNLEATSPANADQEAAVLINATVEKEVKKKGSVDGQQLAAKIEEDIDNVSDGAREKISQYVDGMEKATKEGDIQKLEEGIGGQVDTAQQKTIAAETLKVHEGVEQTLARMDETGRHEQYHLDNEHTKGIAHAPGKEDDVAVTIGGQDFDETAFIEGLTVERTGDKFVSDTYKTYKRDFRTAIHKAGVSIEEVEAAVKEKDLGRIDDAARKQDLALAA